MTSDSNPFSSITIRIPIRTVVTSNNSLCYCCLLPPPIFLDLFLPLLLPSLFILCFNHTDCFFCARTSLKDHSASESNRHHRILPSANQRPLTELPAVTDVMFWYQPEAASASFSSSFNNIRKMRWPLPSIPYPPEQAGYWSPVTSTLNWCEEVGLIDSHNGSNWAGHPMNQH